MAKSRTFPAEWKAKRLSEIATPITDKVGDGEYETLSISAGVGFVNQAEKFGKELSGNQYTHYIVIRNGDFSYNKGNSKRYPQGCVYMLKERKIAAVPNVFNSFRIEGQCGDYYEQLFISGYLNDQLFSKINAGVRNDGLLNLYDDDFYSCVLPLPPLPEQRAIAEILTTADRAIILRERLIAAKQAQKRWLMQNLLTGKMQLPGFSGKWESVKLGEVFSERTETNCAEQELLSVTGSSGIIPHSDIESKNNSSEDKNNYRKVCKGDIAYNTMRMWQGVSALSDFEGIVSPAYTVIIPCDSVDGRYCSYLFKLPKMIYMFYRYSQGLVDDTRNLKYSNFERITTTIPPLPEQTAIVEILTTADREIDLLNRQLEQQRQVKKYLMQQLLTGRIRVRGEVK